MPQDQDHDPRTPDASRVSPTTDKPNPHSMEDSSSSLPPRPPSAPLYLERSSDTEVGLAGHDTDSSWGPKQAHARSGSDPTNKKSRTVRSSSLIAPNHKPKAKPTRQSSKDSQASIKSSIGRAMSGSGISRSSKTSSQQKFSSLFSTAAQRDSPAPILDSDPPSRVASPHLADDVLRYIGRSDHLIDNRRHRSASYDRNTMSSVDDEGPPKTKRPRTALASTIQHQDQSGDDINISNHQSGTENNQLPMDQDSSETDGRQIPDGSHNSTKHYELVSENRDVGGRRRGHRSTKQGNKKM